MGNKPTHKVFFVQDINSTNEAGKTNPLWRQIGVAWSHRSGKGYQMKLDLIPADFSGGDIVVLEATEKPDDMQEAA